MTTRADSDDQPEISLRAGGRPRLIGRVGSLDAFWPLIEPALTALRPRRLCEIGVDQGIFTDRLLAWGEKHGCAYVGIDPAPDPAVSERVRRDQRRETGPDANDLILGRSLEALRELAPCEAYFIDGDHNYYTVRNELDLIERAAARRPAGAVGPILFAHDVSWPWARRDMYHQPAAIPPEERHPCSANLGVSLEGDELVAGGLRSEDRYSIALHSGGPRNGVLTAIEDFLSSGAGRGWQSIIVPVAYGLAVLYRPETIPEPCRVHLDRLRTAAGVTDEFFGSCEANFLHLYLYSEDVRAQLDYLTGSKSSGRSTYEQMEQAYRDLEYSYRDLEHSYRDLTAHSESLLQEFNRLLGAYTELDAAFRRLRDERDALQRRLVAAPGLGAP